MAATISIPPRPSRPGNGMLAEGADIVDIGGESTRPGAAPDAAARGAGPHPPRHRGLGPAGAVVSIDTRNAATMARALDAGARIVNDVTRPDARSRRRPPWSPPDAAPSS